MIYVFMDYPNPTLTIHRDPSCRLIHRQTIKHVHRREMNIYLENLTDSLLKFKNEEVDFRAEAGWNCLWLKLDFGDFDTEMDRNEENIQKYINFISSFVKNQFKKSKQFDAVSEVIDYGSRVVENQNKVTTRFQVIGDLITEANYWADKENSNYIEEKHITKAIEEKEYRSNLIEKRYLI